MRAPDWGFILFFSMNPNKQIPNIQIPNKETLPYLIRKQQRQDEGHDHADDNLQRQAYLYVIHKRVATRLHHQRIGGVENGEAKHMLAPSVTAKRKE